MSLSASSLTWTVFPQAAVVTGRGFELMSAKEPMRALEHVCSKHVSGKHYSLSGMFK